MISSARRAIRIVGQGSPAVSSRSSSKRGVVQNPINVSQHMLRAMPSHKRLTINISHVVDGASPSCGDLSTTLEFDGNWILSKAGPHSEVCDTRNKADSCRYVMEKSMRLRPRERHAHHSKGTSSHDGADGEVPIRPASCYIKIRLSKDISIVLECVIAHCCGSFERV